jgi:hypothetical protein
MQLAVGMISRNVVTLIEPLAGVIWSILYLLTNAVSLVHVRQYYKETTTVLILLATVFYIAKPVKSSLLMGHLGSTLDFCHRPARKKMNVPLTS